MKLSNLDRHPSGSAPLSLALRWLETLTRGSGPVGWNAEQMAAARQALAEARELMATDVLTLAARHFPNREARALVAAPTQAQGDACDEAFALRLHAAARELRAAKARQEEACPHE